MSVDATEGATANAASAAAVSFGSSDISVFSLPAADDATMPTASAAATLADPASPDAAVDTVMSLLSGESAVTTYDITGAIPPPNDTADGAANDTHASTVTDDTTRRCKRRRRHAGCS